MRACVRGGTPGEDAQRAVRPGKPLLPAETPASRSEQWGENSALSGCHSDGQVRNREVPTCSTLPGAREAVTERELRFIQDGKHKIETRAGVPWGRRKQTAHRMSDVRQRKGDGEERGEAVTGRRQQDSAGDSGHGRGHGRGRGHCRAMLAIPDGSRRRALGKFRWICRNGL